MTISPIGNSSLRDTLRHTAIYSLAGVLGRMISFFMLPFYAHILRNEGYGVIGMLDAGLVFFAALVGWNFHVSLIRIHAETPVARQPRVVPTGTVVMGSIVAALVLVACLASRPLSSLLLGTPDAWNLVCLAAGAFLLNMIGETALTTLVIHRRSTLYSVLSLVRLFTGIGTSILFVIVLRLDLVGYYLAAITTAAVGAVIAGVVLVRANRFGFDREVARRLLAFQLPLIPGSLASFVAAQVERVVVRFQLGLDQLGVLEMGYKFPLLLSMLFVEPFMRSWAPEQIKVADEEDGPRRIGDMFLYFLWLLLLFYLLLSANIESLLRLLTPEEFWLAFWIARIEALQVVVKALPRHLGFGIVYAKKAAAWSRIMTGVSVIKVVLSYVLISSFGLFGAAWSALIATTINAAWTWVVARRHYRLDVSRPRLAAIVGAAAAVNVAAILLPRETVAAWGAPAIAVLQDGVNLLAGTPLGAWRDGKLIELLSGRTPEVFDLFVRTAIVLPYVFVGPAIHHPTRMRVLALVKRLRRRVGA